MKLVDREGLEPSTVRLRVGCSTIELAVQLRGAGDGIQTRDLYLGRVPLYQLSYARICPVFSGPGCLPAEATRRRD